MRGGPKTIKNMAARKPGKSCEGARSESRRPKRYKNRGLETSQKCRKSVVSPFWRAAHDPKREKMAFFNSLRAPSQLFVFHVFWGSGGPVTERKLRKRFVSAGFASGGVFGPPCFCQKKRVSENVRKSLRPKKRYTINVFEPYFGPFLAHRFWG